MDKRNIHDQETAATALPIFSQGVFDSITIESSLKASPVYTEVNTSNVYLILKRVFDLLGALLGLLILSPLLIVLAIIIKLEDWNGSIFFSQQRVGLNGKTFQMYKFRSMVVDAESQLNSLLIHNETTGAMFKMSNDPRVTKIGRILRKTSLDELPQLWNVLRGEMSLVGPRPPLPREVLDYTNHDIQRLLVVPGCTGLWQISGRSNIGFSEMVELDLLYIKTRNLWMDFMIVLKTFKVLVGSKDAY